MSRPTSTTSTIIDVDRTERITSLTQKLVRKFVTDEPADNNSNAKRTSQHHAQQLLLYCTRILGSRMSPSITPDEFHVSELIKKKLMKDSNPQAAIQFSDLFRRLTNKQSLTHTWSILYFLHSISDTQTQNPLPTLESAFSSSLRFIPDTRLISLSPSIAHNNTQNKALATTSTSQLTSNLNIIVPANSTPNSINTTPSSTPTPYSLISTQKTQTNSDNEIAEELLVRDVIYALQGIDGRYIRYNSKIDMMGVESSVTVSNPTRELIGRICEVGWLVRRLKKYVDEFTVEGGKFSKGLIHQSLCQAVQLELTDFYRLVAVLEAQINQRTSSTFSLSLRRLAVWIQDPLQRLKQLSILIDGIHTSNSRGGAIISFIAQYLNHGDPQIKEMVQSVMLNITRPVFGMLHKWIFEGVLEDPYLEFFIAENTSIGVERMWYEGYQIRQEMLPSFIQHELGQKILLIGKSIIFLRRCCNDMDWANESLAVAKDAQGLEYGQTEKIEMMITEASKIINHRLLSLLIGKYRFVDHCNAIKKYLLLGQGDFIQYLMDLIGTELKKSSNELSGQTLLGILHTAIRGSNAQYEDQEILNRLDVCISSKSVGSTGWDVFSLDYHLEPPLTTIFTPDSMKLYLKLFRFMWGLKRVEYGLSSSWRGHMTTSHKLGGMPKVDSFRAVLHQCNTTRNEMMHFVYNLQYYITFEVLETSWGEFQVSIQQASDLDQLISSHSKYLNSIIRRALLSDDNAALQQILQQLLSLIIRFKHIQDHTYDILLQEAQLRMLEDQQDYQKNLESKLGISGVNTSNKVSGTNVKITAFQREMFEVKSQLQQVVSEYNILLDKFRSTLSSSRSMDVNLKFLEFRMDFNEFYQNKRAMSSGSTKITQFK